MVVKSSTESTINPMPLKAEGWASAMAELDIEGFREGFRQGRRRARPHSILTGRTSDAGFDIGLELGLILYADPLVSAAFVWFPLGAARVFA
jgi:hypothetical protein